MSSIPARPIAKMTKTPSGPALPNPPVTSGDELSPSKGGTTAGRTNAVSPEAEGTGEEKAGATDPVGFDVWGGADVRGTTGAGVDLGTDSDAGRGVGRGVGRGLAWGVAWGAD